MWLQGCWWIDDDAVECVECSDRIPFYVNNSGVIINLTVIMETEKRIFAGEDTAYYDSTYTRYKQEIKDNDTLCNYSLNRGCSKRWEIIDHYYENDWIFVKSSRYTSSDIYKPMYFKIEFLSEPKTCLVFDGDKMDNDIRYWENYILIEKYSYSDISSYYYSYMYYFYITPEHKAMAREEYCLL